MHERRNSRGVAAWALVWVAAAGLHCNPKDGHDPDYVAPPTPPDESAPTFAGVKLATAISETEVQLTWAPAADDQTPAAQITYRIYVAPTADALDFTKPALTTPAGASGAVVPKLHPTSTYSFAVRAVDLVGLADDNVGHVEATLPDKTPPTFGGVESVTGTGPTSLLVKWSAATDNGSAPAKIRYAVYVAAASGKQDFAAPVTVTPYATLSASIDGLKEAARYYVVVRAIDETGNVTPSVKEIAGTTLDKTPPTFEGLKSLTVSGTTISFAWAAAKDAVDPADKLVYDIFQAAAPGGQDFTKPPAFTVAGATSFSSNAFDAGKRYYFVVRARDTSGNEDGNLVEKNVTTAASADVTPPTFGGLVTAAPTSRTTVDLAWADAVDDYTPSTAIEYDVYVATASGAEDYTKVSPPMVVGKTTITITGLLPATTYYFVVRAKDAAGNQELNTIERSAVTLP